MKRREANRWAMGLLSPPSGCSSLFLEARVSDLEDSLDRKTAQFIHLQRIHVERLGEAYYSLPPTLYPPTLH
jgi:hypothetical protein